MNIGLKIIFFILVDERERIMQILKKKWCCRLIVTALSLLLLTGSFNLMIPGVAIAEPSNSLEITGDGVTKPVTFTLA